MTEQQFCYWLQGFAELNQGAPTSEQWKSIREHLASVFNKVTPPVIKPTLETLMIDKFGPPSSIC